MSDPLSELKPEDLAAFYKRLAEFALAANEAAKRDGRDYVSTPLAPVMLLKWLENRSTSTVFAVDPPSHLRQSAEVASALSFGSGAETSGRGRSRPGPLTRVSPFSGTGR